MDPAPNSDLGESARGGRALTPSSPCVAWDDPSPSPSPSSTARTTLGRTTLSLHTCAHGTHGSGNAKIREKKEEKDDCDNKSNRTTHETKSPTAGRNKRKGKQQAEKRTKPREEGATNCNHHQRQHKEEKKSNTQKQRKKTHFPSSRPFRR